MGIVVTSGKPTWCNGSTLAWNARDVHSSPALVTVFPIFITPTMLVAVTMDPFHHTHDIFKNNVSGYAAMRFASCETMTWQFLFIKKKIPGSVPALLSIY